WSVIAVAERRVKRGRRRLLLAGEQKGAGLAPVRNPAISDGGKGDPAQSSTPMGDAGTVRAMGAARGRERRGPVAPPWRLRVPTRFQKRKEIIGPTSPLVWGQPGHAANTMFNSSSIAGLPCPLCCR